MTKGNAAEQGLTDKTCKQITDLVFDYVNDKLTASVKRDFERHLRICPDCVNFLNTYKKTVATTRSVKAEELPPKVRANILDFLRKRIRRLGAFVFCIWTQWVA